MTAFILCAVATGLLSYVRVRTIAKNAILEVVCLVLSAVYIYAGIKTPYTSQVFLLCLLCAMALQGSWSRAEFLKWQQNKWSVNPNDVQYIDVGQPFRYTITADSEQVRFFSQRNFDTYVDLHSIVDVLIFDKKLPSREYESISLKVDLHPSRKATLNRSE